MRMFPQVDFAYKEYFTGYASEQNKVFKSSRIFLQSEWKILVPLVYTQIIYTISVQYNAENLP